MYVVQNSVMFKVKWYFYSFIDINIGVIIVKVEVKQLAHVIDCFY